MKKFLPILAVLVVICIIFAIYSYSHKYERAYERAQKVYDVQSGITQQMLDDYNDLQSDIDSIQEQQRALGID